MPALSLLYEDHIDQRDQFEMIAIHDSKVRSLVELDEKMQSIMGDAWVQSPLKFPIAIDRNGETEKAFYVDGHPTYRVIDPDGRIVGDALRALENKLPLRKPSVVISRSFDIRDDAPGSWKTPTIKDALWYFRRELRQEVVLDPATAKAEDISEETTVPIFVVNACLTLRSLDQLMFRHMGLAIEADDLNGQLLLRKTSLKGEHEPVPSEKLEERLAGTANANEQITDLVLEEISLEDAVRRIATHFDLSMGIHPTVLDRLTAPVSGVIVNSELGPSLNATLKPLGLWIRVWGELLMVEPIRH